MSAVIYLLISYFNSDWFVVIKVDIFIAFFYFTYDFQIFCG